MLDRQLSPKLAYNNYSPANVFDNQHLNFGEGWQATFPDEKPLTSALDGGHPYARQPSSRLAPSAILARCRKFLSRYPIFSDLASTSSNSRRSIGPLTTPSPSSAVSMSRFILLCSFWYTTSALSSNTGKTILMQFQYPVTLTIIQFAFVAGYCLLLMSPVIQFTKLRPPTGAILRSTLPMGMFQVGGHMFSSMAIAKTSVSTVHTIKALSPLFTVAAYAMLFGVKYSPKTYFSLLPLTIGVMLACTFESASSPTGLLCAFGSALVFVSSNIFFKKIMPSGSQTSSHKLDKLNLLFYSSAMAFALMIPIWSFTDFPRLLAADSAHVTHPTRGHEAPHTIPYYFFMNGTVHFAQNIIAFVILSSTSPVTYSIASLIKRVAVICIAIVWFNQSVHPMQGLGIGMTFVGLYMYNTAKSDVERGENRMRRVEATRDMMLPINRTEEKLLNGSSPPTPVPGTPELPVAATTGMGPHSAGGRPRVQIPTNGRLHSDSHGYGHPNLHIQISPKDPSSIFSKRHNISPTEPYPSPPPSIDSPPSNTIPIGYQPPRIQQHFAESLTVGHVVA
ncbi:triose-phosphate transporter family-domain-containing protein [Suillus clintonianus]|uniref:triose-phosphate transporter family-domain-containing protein n=1 Tax=Suillus clintonianus TaxID=1904413 RepID=UPI001B86356E|nr:triose-phosphate transporter family-domain-containing protein [Suillus clintonianus]KAG2141236.1 triose-phosphate transporter family-domain-containing protein [Suillus clintonianus]